MNDFFNTKFKLQMQPLEVFHEKGVLRNFAKFAGKHLCQSLFFNKVAGRGLHLYQDLATRFLKCVRPFWNIMHEKTKCEGVGGLIKWRLRKTCSYAGKCGPEKLRIRTLFTQWKAQINYSDFINCEKVFSSYSFIIVQWINNPLKFRPIEYLQTYIFKNVFLHTHTLGYTKLLHIFYFILKISQ